MPNTADCPKTGRLTILRRLRQREAVLDRANIVADEGRGKIAAGLEAVNDRRRRT